MFWTMYKRELTSASRNFKVPVVITVNNVILAIVAMFSYYLKFYSKEKLGSFAGSHAILEIYTILCSIEFAVVVVTSLVLTTPNIMKEKKDHALEFLISSGVRPITYIASKLCATTSIIMIAVITTAPIIGIVFFVGGVSLKNIVVMYATLLVFTFYMSAIGIYCACICKRNMTAMVLTYLVGVILIAGTLILVSSFCVFRATDLGISIRDSNKSIHIGSVPFLLLLNPLYAFLRMLNEQLGTMGQFFRNVNLVPLNNAKVEQNWVLLSSIVQVTLGMILLILSARRLRKKRNMKKAIFL